MIRIRSLILALLVPMSAAAAGPPRISFVRTIPAPHALGSTNVALIYAMGDRLSINTFVEVFVDHAGRILQLENAIERHQSLTGPQISETTFQALRRAHPADVYLGINMFTCSLTERQGVGSEHDVDGGRIKRKHIWGDAVCTARIDVVSGRDGNRQFSFQVRGEGTSPRVAELTDEERNIAFDQAAHYAAIMAVETVTPRAVRESIELDETAPSFDEALAMIDSSRYADARAILEAALRRHPDSAPLHYDLGAICEVIGDIKDAHEHFEQALRLAPHDRRYRSELNLLVKRNSGL